jgi:hypothetical protein
MHTDRCGNTGRKKGRAKGSGKEVIIQEFRYRDTTNVEPEMYDYTSYNWSHWNGITKSLRKNPEAIPGKHSIDSLQQTAILGTSHIIRKVLQCETESVSGGGHRWFKGSGGEKWPVARNNDDNDNNNNNKPRFAITNLPSKP